MHLCPGGGALARSVAFGVGLREDEGAREVKGVARRGAEESLSARAAKKEETWGDEWDPTVVTLTFRTRVGGVRYGMREGNEVD
ncbi:hypothetical protein LIER_17465 [Lithospermum erythrorhizon]|uniref:Uncharacterized protein n=1 Tax=Lithospermum erythrorhizon TaxID=34254 RepID=A0AAV3QES6_LITER